MFESTANRQPKAHCLGWRPYNAVTKKFGNYQWIDYQTVQKRRAAFGAGLAELHNKHGCNRSGPYGVGLWCQNRPEWQITGAYAAGIITPVNFVTVTSVARAFSSESMADFIIFLLKRLGMYVSESVFRFDL